MRFADNPLDNPLDVPSPLGTILLILKRKRPFLYGQLKNREISFLTRIRGRMAPICIFKYKIPNTVCKPIWFSRVTTTTKCRANLPDTMGREGVRAPVGRLRRG